LWLVYVRDQLYAMRPSGPHQRSISDCGPLKFPYESMAAHLLAYGPGRTQTVVYHRNDERLPEAIRAFHQRGSVDTTIAAPLVLGNRTLGWMTIASLRDDECGGEWRVALLEAIARQGALALHHSRLTEQHRLEERRKAILEERNRLARDIHDNLAQGFAAILMQLQGAMRETGALPPNVALSVETAVDLARTHLTEARRSVGALRPNVGDGEDIATRPEALADRSQLTTSIPIDVVADETAAFRRHRRTRNHRHRPGSADQRGASLSRPPRPRSEHRWTRDSVSGCRWPTTAAASPATSRPRGSA
jgi:hypothetical protein